MSNFDVGAIKTSVKTLLESVTFNSTIKFTKVLTYEPASWEGALPSASIYLDGFTEEQTEVSSLTMIWKFTIRAYVNLYDAKAAQATMDSIVQGVLTAFKGQYSLTNTVMFAIIESGSSDVVMDRDKPILVHAFTLTVKKEED